MKKTVTFLLAALLAFTSCGKKNENALKVGATPVPHAELLNLVVDNLKEKGIELEIVEFTDYVTPNLALNDGQIDVNFFQHAPYMEDFARDRNINLETLAGIHIEPLGLYSKKYTDYKDIPDGAVIAIPNDPSNGGRALLLLQAKGLITIDSAAGLKATERDITENPHNFQIKPLEAAQLPRILDDVDGAVINGNYALEAGMNPVESSLFLEGAESPYVNILTIRGGEKDTPAFKALVEALTSDEVKEFMLNKYNGGVVPVF